MSIIQSIDGKLLKEMILSGGNNLKLNKDLVDKLNVFPVPDGDTGTNMHLTMSSATNEIKKLKSNSINDVAKAMSKGSLMGARGNSGVILSQLIRGFCKDIENKKTLNTVDIATALKQASDTAYKAVIKPIEGTILTVARETGEYAIKISKKENDIIKFFKEIVKEANNSLDKTPKLLKNLKDAGVVDSGGKGLVCIYEGMYKFLIGEEIVVNDLDLVNDTNLSSPNDIDIKFEYCTEFILQSDKISSDKLQDIVIGYGDSLIVVGDDGLIKVHIHTNNPGAVLEDAIKFGSLSKIKIDNMKIQHRNILIDEKNYIKKQVEDQKKYGFIAVTMGEGLSKIFKDFGVDYVLDGGQTMNPSTENFIKAIDNINAQNIIILPNNSNIIMSATQAKELSKKNIAVIPSKNISQGFASLFAFNEDADIKDNERAMKYALSSVKSGQVTFAVRDTKVNDIDILKEDIIGIGEGEIKCSSQHIDMTTLDLIKHLVDEDSEIITLFYGEDVSSDDANSLKSTIEKDYPSLDVEVYYGGQPLYYYIISVE